MSATVRYEPPHFGSLSTAESVGCMRQLQNIKHCMYHDAPRRDIGCLHCMFSLKVGEVWTCWYKPKVLDA